MKSIIYQRDAVGNKKRKFGSANKYFPANIQYADGTTGYALFTENQCVEAIKRANDNPEDIATFVNAVDVDDEQKKAELLKLAAEKEAAMLKAKAEEEAELDRLKIERLKAQAAEQAQEEAAEQARLKAEEEKASSWWWW